MNRYMENKIKDSVILLSKPKGSFIKSNLQNYFNILIFGKNNEKNKEILDYIISNVKKLKFIFLYHKEELISDWVFKNKCKYNYKIGINEPIKEKFTVNEIMNSNFIGNWCGEFTKKRLKLDKKFHTLTLISYSNNKSWDKIKMSYEKREISDKYILSLGNNRRDYNCLIKALNNINIKCIIITKDEIKRKIKNNNDRIEIMSIIDKKELYNMIGNSLFCVLPIDSGVKQGFGLTSVNEFSYLKKPFIISRDTGLDYYLQNDIFGISYKASDEKDLEIKIRYLLKNKKYMEYNDKINKFYEETPDYLTDDFFIKTVFSNLE